MAKRRVDQTEMSIFCTDCKRCLHCNGMGYYVYDPDFYVGIIIKFCGHCKGHGY
jgi:hypothetical protein